MPEPSFKRLITPISVYRGMGSMEYFKRIQSPLWGVFFILLSGCPIADETLQNSTDSFNPYQPSNSINSTNDGLVSELAVGLQHTCAIKSGSLFCWGLNDNGQIGDQDGGFIAGNTDPFSGENPAPKVVLKPHLVMKGAESVAVGYEHTCAVKSNSLYCWGSNEKGQLGLDNRVSANEPVLVPIGEPVSKVRARGYLTCAITQSQNLVCFGSRNTKKANGSVEPVLLSKTPQAPIVSGGITQAALSPSHVCVVQNEALKCLGYNGWGEVGDPARLGQEIPTFFEVFANQSTQVSASDTRTCAIHNGKMMCFGRTLGDRAIDNTPQAKWQVPAPTPYEATFWNGIAPGKKISSSGAVLSSGRELFYGSYFHNQGKPKKISVQTHDFDFSEKDQNGCLMFQNQEIMCWGSNLFGQLGNGEREASESPITQAVRVKF